MGGYTLGPLDYIKRSVLLCLVLAAYEFFGGFILFVPISLALPASFSIVGGHSLSSSELIAGSIMLFLFLQPLFIILIKIFRLLIKSWKQWFITLPFQIGIVLACWFIEIGNVLYPLPFFSDNTELSAILLFIAEIIALEAVSMGMNAAERKKLIKEEEGTNMKTIYKAELPRCTKAETCIILVAIAAMAIRFIMIF